MTERPRVHPNGECSELRRVLGKDFLSRSFLEQFRPPGILYTRPEAWNGLHGEGHSTRVNILGQTEGLLLARRGIAIDPDAIGYFSMTHDLMRLFDTEDRGHGDRSAELVQSAGMVPVRYRDQVAYLNRWHVPHDRFAPLMTYLLAVGKDGDGLDRVREKGALDPTFLRFPESQVLLLPVARLLFELSRQYEEWYHLSPFDAAIQAGSEMGIIGDR